MTLSIASASARATVLDAMWCETDQQLVAVVLAATDKQVLRSLVAELEKNNRQSQVRLYSSQDEKQDLDIWLRGARKGYIRVASGLERFNVQHSHVLALLHHRAHDPRLIDPMKVDDITEPVFFYVVSPSGGSLHDLFLERLQLAIPWPLLPRWAGTLVKIGFSQRLIENLVYQQSDELDDVPGTHVFESGLRVIADPEHWGDAISYALSKGRLSL